MRMCDKPPLGELYSAVVKNQENIDSYLEHYGTKRHSGRYPWGSGDNPYQHSGDFISRVNSLKEKGLKEKEIAEELGLDSTTALRTQLSLAKHERRQLEVDRARSLREDGKSLNEIAEIMGYKNDSSIRALLNTNTEANKNKALNTAEILKKELAEKGMLDVGAGVERELGVSKTKLKEALYILENEGYNVYGIGIPQVTNTGKQTNTKVLCNPETSHKDVYDNMGDIQMVGKHYSNDGGETFNEIKYPASIDSKRVKINYGDEGGKDKDGVIEIRRGVKDLDLGNSHYAQVRILVDGTHYLKGMAMYSDDMPDGADIVFNTNKKSGTPKMEVLKKISNDPDNPFGALIKANGQSEYIDEHGNKKLSAINKLKEEGDWDTMSRNLSSQFLSKQPLQLIKKQLKLTYDDKVAEFDELCQLNNPTIKRKLLNDFADSCDGAVVHLKAAALPRQSTKVILPLTNIKDNEIYAPTYKNGEKVVLIRYPHGGTFEIPTLTVNNKNASGKSVLGNVKDAVGINSKVAERLSGADFDGDQVVVIPVNSKVKVKTKPALEGLKDFDPKEEYPYREGMKVLSKSQKQKQMGIVSNLITDMTIKGAPESDIVRAVKHSMVVIDAEKHKLDYRQSELDNDIASLKKAYQGRVDSDGKYHEGAATLISLAKSETSVPKRQGSPQINEDGSLSYKTADDLYYINSKGKTVMRTQRSTKMAETKDAHTLSSGTPQEEAYAEYANRMKSLANQARKEMMSTGKITYSATAKKIYQEEVDSLNSKLKLSLKNAPRERQAQLIANATVKAKQKENPDMTKAEVKKASQQALTAARNAVGAKRQLIQITDKEWEAIQAGAVSENVLTQILNNADIDSVRQRATPRSTNTQLSPAKQSKIASMNASGYSTSEIAKAIGCSVSTVHKYLS